MQKLTVLKRTVLGGVALCVQRTIKPNRTHTSKRAKVAKYMQRFKFKPTPQTFAKATLLLALKRNCNIRFRSMPTFYKQAGNYYKLYAFFSYDVANNIVHYINAKFAGKLHCKMRLVKHYTNNSNPRYVLLIKQL